MTRTPCILADLSDDDLGWLARVGRREEIASGKALIHAGRPITELSVLLSGSVEIVTPEGLPVDRAGPGEVLGEMSLIDDLRPSVVVHTLEPSRLFIVPHETLSDRLNSDDGFAARFYRAAARALSHRLRTHLSRLGFGPPVVEQPNRDEAAPVTDEQSARATARVLKVLDKP